MKKDVEGKQKIIVGTKIKSEKEIWKKKIRKLQKKLISFFFFKKNL